MPPSENLERPSDDLGLKAAREKLLAQIAAIGFADMVVSLLRNDLANRNNLRTILDEWRQTTGDDQKFLSKLYGCLELTYLLTRYPDSEVPLQQIIAPHFSEAEMEHIHRELSSIGSSVEYYVESMENIEFDELREKADKISPLPTLEKRFEMANQLMEEFGGLVDRSDVFEEGEMRIDEEREMTPVNSANLLTINSRSLVRRIQRGSKVKISGAHQVTMILRDIKAAQTEHFLTHAVGQIDREKLATDTARFGSKGANLLALQVFLERLEQKDIRHNAYIPPFQLLPVDIYDKWKNGEDIEPDLRGFYDQMAGVSSFTRSSAVHSEDGEFTTGAGIYHSEKLEEGASFEEFSTAVKRVYESTDSQGAIAYRRQNGVHEEKMGIVLMKSAEEEDWKGGYGKGYMNSQRPHVPELMDIVFEGRGIKIIVNKELDRRRVWRGRDRYFSNCLHYQLDTISRHADFDLHPAENMAELGALLEMYYGQPVQVEFFSAQMWESALLQTRILPKRLREKAKVDFPEGVEAIHESDAMGIGDMTLDVLDFEDNTENEGVVVVYRSWENAQKAYTFLPKSGAVIVLYPSEETRGHIETLCVEKGLMCLFVSRTWDGSSPLRSSPALDYIGKKSSGRKSGYDPVFHDFAGHKRIRIVSDGLRGRVYPAQE